MTYLVRPGEQIGLDTASPVRPLAAASTELTPSVAPWLQADFEALCGTVLRLPNRSEISLPDVLRRGDLALATAARALALQLPLADASRAVAEASHRRLLSRLN